MLEEIRPREAEAQADRSMPVPDILPVADLHPSQSVQQDKGDDSGDHLDTCGPEEACILSSPPPAESGNVGTPTAVDESDPVEGELVASLDALLAKDAELSATYGALLGNHRKTRRERRAMRAELRQLHTEEGGILLEVKLYRARKGRGGGWAEFLRQRKRKPLSRTTADRWISWFLDSKKEQSQPDPAKPSENAPQNENGAFSGGDAESQPAPSDPQQPVATDPPPANGSQAFEDVQQVVLALKKSQVARFKAAAEFLIGKNGSETVHQAIYVTVIEAAARLGFVYTAAIAKEGETSVSKTVNPGNKTFAAGSETT